MSFNKVNNDGSVTRVAGGTLYADAPVGAIIPYGGTTAPDGFLLCQGQAVSRTTYAELFKVIGTSFGSGDGSTTFNVPDLREATTKGIGLSGKSNSHFDSDGVALGEFVEDRLQAHTHSHKIGSSTAGSEEWVMFATSQVLSGMNQTDYGVIGRFGNTTEVKAVGVNYIIKAKQVDAPADFTPVDVVENGNMKAVTSNAVYDTLMNITTLTPTKTANVGTIYEAEFLRIGRLVFVNLNLIVSSGILFTGLPKPTSRQTFTINGFYEQDKALRLIINTNGSIETDNDLAITNQNVGGHIVYITTEN